MGSLGGGDGGEAVEVVVVEGEVEDVVVGMVVEGVGAVERVVTMGCQMSVDTDTERLISRVCVFGTV